MVAAAESLARGRRLQRIAMWLLAGALVSLAGAVGGGLVAAEAGWIAEDDATIALVGLAVSLSFFVAMFIVGIRGNRLVRASVREVGEQAATEVPEAVCFGYRRPMRLLAIVVPPYVAALVSLPFWAPNWSWVCPVVMGAIGLVCLIGIGPEPAGFTGGCVDASGVWLPAVGLRLPWSSIRTVVATSHGIEVRITTGGAVERTGGVPRHWTENALRKGRSGQPLTAYSARPEVAAAVAARYLRKDPPAPSP